MQLLLLDHSRNERRTIQVEGDSLTVGRDGDCTIVLENPFVARRHLRISRRGQQLVAEALTHAGTLWAGRHLTPGDPTPIAFGDELQLGPFSLIPLADARPTDAAESRPHRDQRELLELEQSIHAELLERMNLRATGVRRNDPAVVEQVQSQLAQLIRARLEQMEPRLVEHALCEHLRRLVMAEIIRQAQGRVPTDYRDADERTLDPEQERNLHALVSSFVDRLPLLLEPARLHDDLALAEQRFDEVVRRQLRAIERPLRDYVLLRTLMKDITDVLFGLGPLQDLIEMPNVSEIMVVGPDRIYIEKNGVIEPTTRSFFSEELLLAVIERILAPIGRRVDTSTPLVDARLVDGSRVHAIIPPLSLVGPCLTIRRFGWVPFTMDDLIERQTLSAGCAAFLRACVVHRCNLVICGGTASGKTTLMNILAGFAERRERIITIEESAELNLPQPHVVRLEGRPANIEGRGGYTIRDLVRNALRMRPDRILVGEVRGPEALDMLQAMNTGHDGSLSTLHANTPIDAIKRLETLVLMALDIPMHAIREQISSALDVVVQIARLADGRRRITHISEVTGVHPVTGQVELHDVFHLPGHDSPRLRHTGYLPTFAQRMVDAGHISPDVFI